MAPKKKGAEKGNKGSSKGKGKGKPIAGKDQFVFPTGDRYDGEFLAYSNGTIFKHGIGTYSTWDGQVYRGRWVMDRLATTTGDDVITIEHADGTKYEGPLKNQQYDGDNCKITFPDESVMKCSFQKNYPVGRIIFTDPNKHEWVGKAEPNCIELHQQDAFRDNYPKKDLPEMSTKVERNKEKATDSTQ